MARAALGHFQVGALVHGPTSPAARCAYCGEIKTIAHAFGCTTGHAGDLQGRHNEIGAVLVDAAVKLGKWPREDIVVEISLGAFGEHDDDHRRNLKRIDIYFIDRECYCVVAVEPKCSSESPAAGDC